MKKNIFSLKEASKLPLLSVGGKAKNLSTLFEKNFPVPEAFVITTKIFKQIINKPEIRNKFEELFLSSFSDKEMENACHEIEKKILATTLPSYINKELDKVFLKLTKKDKNIIVRSSATMEDTANTSFAGMLTSWPNIGTLEELMEAIKKCLSSVFTPKVILYSLEKKIHFQDFGVAVLLQEMISPERSGLVFSRDPTHKSANKVVVEAIYGFGEDVVSGEVTPERYLFSLDQKKIILRKRGRQKEYLLPSGEKKKISSHFKSEPVLSDREVLKLAKFGIKAEKIFNLPQDLEWVYSDGKFYILQSRPLIFCQIEDKLFPQIGEHTVILRGVGVSPNVSSGEAIILEDEHIQPLTERSVVVVKRLTNDLAVNLRSVAAVIADEGGATSHGANILREFQVPCVLATTTATSFLNSGDVITVDGFRGVVYQGDLSVKTEEINIVPETETKVFISVLVPGQAKSIAAHADGISSMRDDFFIMESGIHPLKLIKEGNAELLEENLYEGIAEAVNLFPGKPIWYKTMDAPTDEFRRLEGGEEEPEERNPLLGWRGIGRELQEPELLNVELKVIKRIIEKNNTNIGIKVPFVRFVEEYEAFKNLVSKIGLQPHKDVELGISVETPGTVFMLQDFIDLGLDFISIGTSDLVMCALALDRESQMVAHKFSPSHPAVVQLLKIIINTAHKNNIFTCACGESARDPYLLPILLQLKIDAIGVSIPYFTQVKRDISQLEKASLKLF